VVAKGEYLFAAGRERNLRVEAHNLVLQNDKEQSNRGQEQQPGFFRIERKHVQHPKLHRFQYVADRLHLAAIPVSDCSIHYLKLDPSPHHNPVQEYRTFERSKIEKY
jgi:hypothetical protein